MALGDGTYRIGAPNGRLLVRTSRTGLGRRAGHDLTIEATRWSGEATVLTGEPSRSSVTVTVEAASLEVREGTGGIKPLTDSDRAEIRRTMQGGDLLDAVRHPEITFRSTAVSGTPEDFTVTGELTLKGATHPLTVHSRVAEDGRLRGEAVLTQSAWGIKPYSAFLGALRLADEVRVEFDLAATDSAPHPDAT
jgi:polyisoprenoid-binding protein YceI